MVDLTAAEVFRDFVSDGIPSSGEHDPNKPDIRRLLGQYEQIIRAFTSNGGLIYSSLAALNADLSKPANSMAWVMGDPIAANNGVYGKVGAPGVGSWTRRADLPFSFIIASDAGAGTPNAIQATTAIPVSGSALVWMNVAQENAGSPVTVSFNGGSALTIKSNSGNDIEPGGLVAGMIIAGIATATEFRLLSDQANAALVAAMETLVIEARQYRDEALAAASGVDLPPVEANRMLVDNAAGTERESKTFAEVRDLLDPLRGFAADGVTDDTAKFADIRTLNPGRTIDLKGAYYRVTDIPVGFENGWFVKSNNAPVTPADICYPAEGTLLGDQMTIATGPRYAGWPQGGMHGFGGQITFKFNEGSDHIATDHHVRVVRMSDGGLSVREFERCFQSLTASNTCWAFGECDGQEIAVVRENDPPTAHHLMVRPLQSRRTVTASIVTTAGSNAVQILIAAHGRRSGNKFKIKDSISIDGLTIVGGTEYTVTNGTPSRFYFTIGSGVAAVGVTESHTFTIEFIGSKTWGEISFAGDSFGKEIQDFGVHTSLPSLITGCEAISASGGTVIFGCQGGGSQECMVEVTGLLGNTPTISKVVPVGTASRAEPLFRRSSNGDRFMMARTQAANNSPEFAFSTDGGNAWTAFINGPRETFQYSPFDYRIVDDTHIVVFCCGNRTVTPDVGSGYARGFVPGYILVGEIAALKAQGWPAFRIYFVGDIFHFNNILLEEVNAVGVGSMLIFQDYICLAYSADSWDDAASATSDGEVYFARIHLGNFLPQYQRSNEKIIGQGALGVSRGGPPPTDISYIERVVGSSTFQSIAAFNGATGAKLRGFGISVTRTATGKYTVALQNQKSGVFYFPFVTLIGSGDRRYSLTSLGVGQFTLETYAYGSATAQDCDFVVGIVMLEDFARNGWST